MIILNIDEKRWYSYKKGFAEDVINDMFKEYFNELYQENAAKRRVKEIWEKISTKIPKEAIFVEKDSVLYSVTSDLKFEVTPKDFFEIDEVSHPILIECFNHCYLKFRGLIENYKDWNGEDSDVSLGKIDTMINVYWIVSQCVVAQFETLPETIKYARDKFEKILSISLKSKMCNQICSKISDMYESVILQSNPIMLMTKIEGDIQKIYAVTSNLEMEEVTFSLIERELEETIHEVIPEDTDYLVNRIYNFMMLPLKGMEPYIRINRIQKSGINATLFLRDKEIPVVSDLEWDYFYTFLKTDIGTKYFPISNMTRYLEKSLDVKRIPPSDGMEKIKQVNNEMFDEITCYVADYTKRYVLEHAPKEFFYLYKLKNGKINPVIEEGRSFFSSTRDYETTIYKNTDEYNTIEKETKKAKQQGCYSFWKIPIE